MSDRRRGIYEERTLAPDFARAGGRRAAAARYRAFIPDPIASESPALSSQAAALCERAGAAVRELNGSRERLVSLEGLARQLLRSEALASSRIEGLTISHRRLAQAAIEGQGDHRAMEVLGNMRAMEEAVRIGAQAHRISTDDIRAIHRALATVAPLDRIAGQLRTEQGWIGGATPAVAEYVGPPAEHVERLVGDLCLFVDRDDMPAVAQAAFAHAQFELIHPFGDGNGRVGRALIHVILRRRDLAPVYAPPVSLVFGAGKDAYIAGLTAFQEGDAESWVLQFARAVEVSAHSAERFSRRVSETQAEWLRRAGPLRADATARRIVESLPSFPFITSAIVQELTGRSDVAALRGLQALERAGILTRHRNRRRGDSWEAGDLFALLDDFEDEIGRSAAAR